MNDDQREKPPLDLRTRTKQFALRIVRMCAALPLRMDAQVLGKQALRSGTSIGAHYREASRAKSDADFISKLETALQELDETAYWLELIAESGLLTPERVQPLLAETHELLAIFTTIVKKRKTVNKAKG